MASSSSIISSTCSSRTYYIPQKEVEASDTISLLRDAMRSIEKIKGKDTIFFIGNAGAGKSTAVGFLLGAKMEESRNHAGDLMLRYAPGQDESLLPKIGQSLGQSETLYTTGYIPSSNLQKQIRKETIAIADCPGFLDTRGSEYELCTNLSMDEAVNHTASIEAVIAVAPAASFLVDKASPILALIETVRDRFPFAFSTSSENDKVFLLITKCKQIQTETLMKLKDGTTFAFLLEKVDQQIKELQKKITETGEFSFQIESLERQKRTWESLVTMNRRNQIDYIDVNKSTQPRTLLTKYSRKENSRIRKSSYSKAMDNGAMQEKFGKSVEISANTWEYHIFRKFLEEIPRSLETYKRNIDEKRIFLKEKTKQLEEKSNEVLFIKSTTQKLQNILAKAEQELSNKKQIETKGLISQVLEEHKAYAVHKECAKADLSLEITTLLEEEKSLLLDLEKKQEEKRYLALLIVSEWETCFLLRRFSDIVLREPSPQFTPIKKPSTVESCAKFVAIYDQHADEILKKANECLEEAYIQPLQSTELGSSPSRHQSNSSDKGKEEEV